MSEQSTQPDTQPNILFITTDQQRVDSIGAYGNDWVDTPTLDHLATDGTRFDHAYTPSAICSPARGAILTGMRPHRNGLTRNVDEGTSLADDYPCYPQRLRDVGYNVGHVGKMHVGQSPSAFGMDGEHYPGWYYPHDHPDYKSYLDEHGFPEMKSERLVKAFPDEGETYQSGAVDDRPVEASFTHFLTERALDQLDEYADDAPDTPFYLSVQYFGPHNPYYLPEEHLHRYDPDDMTISESAIKETFNQKPWAHRVQSEKSRLADLAIDDWRRQIAAYHGWVWFIDHEIGRLLDALEDAGIRENTVVVFTSDHGAFLTRHKMHDKGPAMYEDIYNVPFILNGIKGIDENEDAFVSLLDLAPTFCELAGSDVPETYDGRSLLTLSERTGDWRDHVRAEFHGHQFAYEQRMIRDDRYKLVLNAFDTNEFYDLHRDPNELHNQIGNPEYGATSNRLYNQLVDDLRAEGDPFAGESERKISKISDVGFDEHAR
jgi:arylsulfatase A-like enzyme